jgi:hypothetical protein
VQERGTYCPIIRYPDDQYQMKNPTEGSASSACPYMAAVTQRIESAKAGAQCRSMDCVFDQDPEIEALFTGTGQLDLASLLNNLDLGAGDGVPVAETTKAPEAECGADLNDPNKINNCEGTAHLVNSLKKKDPTDYSFWLQATVIAICCCCCFSCIVAVLVSQGTHKAKKSYRRKSEHASARVKSIREVAGVAGPVNPGGNQGSSKIRVKLHSLTSAMNGAELAALNGRDAHLVAFDNNSRLWSVKVIAHGEAGMETSMGVVHYDLAVPVTQL